MALLILLKAQQKIAVAGLSSQEAIKIVDENIHNLRCGRERRIHIFHLMMKASMILLLLINNPCTYIHNQVILNLPKSLGKKALPA